MKKQAAILGLLCLVLVGFLDVYSGVHYEWIVSNSNSNGLAEVRVKNDGNCYGDVIVAGSTFSDGSNFLPGETGMVAESPCRGMHFRSNSNSYVRFSVGITPVELFQIDRGGLWIGPQPNTPATPGQGFYLYVGGDGLYVVGKNGTRTKIANN